MSPLMDIVPTGATPDLQEVRGVIFTSANGVRFGGAGRDLPTFCVGAVTTAAAIKAGWAARQSGDTAENLVETLVAERPAGPMLHIGGVHRRGDVAGRLTRAGIATRSVDVYEQVMLPLTPEAKAALTGPGPVVVPLYSPRAAAHFAGLVPPTAQLHIVAISAAAMAETLDLAATSRIVAPEPNAQSMGDTVANLLRRVEAGHAPK